MGGEWDKDVVKISMKSSRIKRSDSALESPSLTKLVSIKFLGVLGYFRGADVTTRRSYLRLWGGVGYRRGSDLNEKFPYQKKR